MGHKELGLFGLHYSFLFVLYSLVSGYLQLGLLSPASLAWAGSHSLLSSRTVGIQFPACGVFLVPPYMINSTVFFGASSPRYVL